MIQIGLRGWQGMTPEPLFTVIIHVSAHIISWFTTYLFFDETLGLPSSPRGGAAPPGLLSGTKIIILDDYYLLITDSQTLKKIYYLFIYSFIFMSLIK